MTLKYATQMRRYLLSDLIMRFQQTLLLRATVPAATGVGAVILRVSEHGCDMKKWAGTAIRYLRKVTFAAINAH